MIVIFLFALIVGMMSEELGDGIILAAFLIAEISLWVACAMRLRDAGKSLAHLLIMLVLHIYVIVIGCYKSEEECITEEPEWMKKDTEDMSGEDSR